MGPSIDETEIIDEETFHEQLTQLVVEANNQGVSISGRSWECVDKSSDRRWDVKIHRCKPK